MKGKIKVNFTWWGNTKHLDIPDYCMVDDFLYSSRCSAVGASIGRRNRLVCCNARFDGRAPDGAIFELTFGHPCKTGGCSVEATLWIRIPD